MKKMEKEEKLWTKVIVCSWQETHQMLTQSKQADFGYRLLISTQEKFDQRLCRLAKVCLLLPEINWNKASKKNFLKKHRNL